MQQFFTAISEGNMIFEQIRAGGDRNFSYVIGDETSREAAIVDPGDTLENELQVLKEHDLTLKYIINTHGHFDHTGGNAELQRRTGALIVAHSSSSAHFDIGLEDGDILNLGGLALTILHTPGHTSDSICILAGGELVTGDTLFVGKVGGTGFGKDARDEYDSLHGKLMVLPPEVRVWPGHDYGVRPTSTIGEEMKTNPFIRRDSFESFVDLKQNWLQYKQEHGIS